MNPIKGHMTPMLSSNYLKLPREVNTYLSRDGGLSWQETMVGPYIYEFGDHGGLVVRGRGRE